MDSIEHLHDMNKDYYRQIILRVVQSNYPSLLARFKFITSHASGKLDIGSLNFSSIHKEIITFHLASIYWLHINHFNISVVVMGPQSHYIKQIC